MIKNKKSVMEMCGISRKSSPLNEKIPTEKLAVLQLKCFDETIIWILNGYTELKKLLNTILG